MKVFLVFIMSILFSFSSCGQSKFWEELNYSQKSDILGVCKSESIKKFYEGHFVLSDDEKTEKLLNELVTSNDTILPLSFYLFNKICTQSDGAVAEIVSYYCVKLVALYPNYFLAYFTKERALNEKKHLLETYAMFIGSELYFKEKGTSDLKYSYDSFKEILNSATKKNRDIEETLKIFWQLVDETIKNMD